MCGSNVYGPAEDGKRVGAGGADENDGPPHPSGAMLGGRS
jgi:hypothetical protein